MIQSKHLDLASLFSDADSNFTRSATLEILKHSISSVAITSAISKCLDFNKCAQQTDSKFPRFFLVSNARPMCEELIYSALFKLIGQQDSDELVTNLNHLSMLRNVHAQTRFFALNNQLQPTFGGFKDSTKQKKSIEEAVAITNDIWRRLGLIDNSSHRPPSISHLSRTVGLEAIYDYVYHLTSNFVHFNPGQLFRTGWGDKEGSFSFSVDNFENYFSDLSKFLGALIFLGYCHTYPDKFGINAANGYVDTITNCLKGNFRWPEITTYEEMNQAWPNNIILRSVMTVVRADDPNAMPDLLTELQGLAKLGTAPVSSPPPSA